MLSQDDVIYFVVVDRFYNGHPDNDQNVDPANPQAYHGGDFAGIMQRIPYLQHLGVTALWITPVYQQIEGPLGNGSWPYHGYWPLDFETVDSHLYSQKPGIEAGSKRYLKDLVDQLHAAGIKVILDMVVNHTGYNHPGLRDDPSTPIKASWFNRPQSESEAGDIGSWLAGLPDLNGENPEVADYFTRVIGDWIAETGVDAIRMDTAKHVESLFWHYYKTAVKGPYPSTTLLGEVLEFNIDQVSKYQQHFAFDSLFDFPLQKAIEEVFIYGQDFGLISSPWSGKTEQGSGILDRDTDYTNHNRLVTLLDNHDLNSRFLTNALNHYHGNRAAAVQTLMLANTFLFTTRGIPQIYYGTELGLEGGSDPDNRRDMPWEKLPNGLEPDSKDVETYQIFNHIRTLIKLRKTSEALRYGDQINLFTFYKVAAYLRNYRDKWVIVVYNLEDSDMTEPVKIDIAQNLHLPPLLKAKINNQQFIDLLRVVGSGKLINGMLEVKLPARSACILMPFQETFASLLQI